MKIKHFLQIGMASLAAASAWAQAGAGAQAPAQAVSPPAAAPTLTDPQLVEEFGWFIAKRVGLPELQFNPDETEALIRGFAAAVKGKDSPFDLQASGPQMDALMQRKQGAYLQKTKQQNLTENADFFSKLKQDKNVVELPSGLRFEILKPGDGDYPKSTETVTVNYTGKLINGSVFDSSIARGKPAEFRLDQVIPGWSEGIQKINKGGKIKLYIPPQLAYGDAGRPGIPPGSTLIFEVELIDIKPAPATPPATPPAAPPAAPTPPPGG